MIETYFRDDLSEKAVGIQMKCLLPRRVEFQARRHPFPSFIDVYNYPNWFLSHGTSADGA